MSDNEPTPRKTYKIAYSGWQVIELDAESIEDAAEKFWDNGLNDLYDAVIGEIIEADQPFKHHPDLN